MLKSFWTGIIQATSNWQMVLVLLAASLGMAIPVVVPIFLVITMTSSSTLAPYSLIAHKMSVTWLIDLFNERFAGYSLQSVGAQVGVMLLVAAFFSLLLNVFFAGGIIEVLSDGYSKFSLRRFWAGSGSWFPRFFRLWLISLVPYGAAIGGFAIAINFINKWDKQAISEKPGAIASLLAIGVLVLVLMVINMIIDYARIGAVINHTRGMFKESLRGFRFSMRRFVGAFGLYFLIAVAGVAVFALIAVLRGSFSQSSLIAALFALVIAQVAIGARLWNRVTFYAAQIDYYRRFAPPPPVIEPLLPPPPPPEFMAATTDPVVE